MELCFPGMAGRMAQAGHEEAAFPGVHKCEPHGHPALHGGPQVAAEVPRGLPADQARAGLVHVPGAPRHLDVPELHLDGRL
eukprot:scaffold74504_cov41-Prasinocladus_malaysianus.AAC.1